MSTEHDTRLPQISIKSTNMPRNKDRETKLHSTGRMERLPQDRPIGGKKITSASQQNGAHTPTTWHNTDSWDQETTIQERWKKS